MLSIVVRRVVSSLAAIFGATLLAFIFLRVAPANPARLILGQFASDDAVAALTEKMGLNDPLPVQFGNFVVQFFTGDWGFSYSVGQSVAAALGDRLPASIELGLYAFGFALVGALVLGVAVTYKHRPVFDQIVNIAGFFGLGLAPFWLGIVLLLIFSQQTGLFPGPDGRLSPGVEPPPAITRMYTVDALLSGRIGTFADALWHLVLPAFTLGVASLAFLTRLLRANLRDVSRAPFILVAESKGLTRLATFRRHALPNAMIPTLMAAGLIFGQMLAGSVLVETVFHWPGVGALITDGILANDFSVVQVFVLLAAVGYVLINLVVDLIVARIDPRLRVETEADA